MLDPTGAVGIYGNHDCSGDTLGDADALARLVRRSRLTLLDERSTWSGELGGRRAVIGGTPWGRPIPEAFDRDGLEGQPATELVLWLVHADLLLPGRTDGIELHEIPGVDLVVNGHVHSRLPLAKIGATTWCNPGSISRYSGSSTARCREPAALRVDVSQQGFEPSWIAVPHSPATEVFPNSKTADVGSGPG
jgi:hypothetical protein